MLEILLYMKLEHVCNAILAGEGRAHVTLAVACM